MKKQKRIARQVKRKKRVLSQDDEADFAKPISQADFAKAVGIPQQNVSLLYRYNVLSPEGTGRDWTREYMRFQFGIIYAKQGWAGLAKAMGD